jgi:hypothetical protein
MTVFLMVVFTISFSGMSLMDYDLRFFAGIIAYTHFKMQEQRAKKEQEEVAKLRQSQVESMEKANPPPKC